MASGLEADREQRVLVPEHVRFRQIDDELIILDLQRGDYFSLNTTGAKMWHALAAGGTPAEIAASLVGQYTAECDVLLQDCLCLVDELLARGLLTRVTA